MAAKHERRVVLLTCVATGLSVVSAACHHGHEGGSPKAPASGDAEGDISPAEDLMREHGVLARVLLIYEEGLRRLDTPDEKAPLDELEAAASIVRHFIEDYHEKLEEDYLFPRFEKASKHAALTAELRRQHQAGRNLTDKLFGLLRTSSMPNTQERQQLSGALRSFLRMYRPHAAREDTVLFPALPSVASPQELKELGERFEEKEHALLGEAGFERVVSQVASIEAKLGIGDLAMFTPS